MKITGIIAEYNPFHNGHKFHIQEAKRLSNADATIIVMSGNYVQRGDVAIFDKQTRARAAILGGADLVIELPAVCAATSAEFFADTSVTLMNALNCVDCLAFGAEASDIANLTETAKFLTSENETFDQLIREKLKTGISYPAARAEVVAELCGENCAAVLREPNNILAVEYLKALISQNSDITPILINRKAVKHDDTQIHGNFASASHIRELIKENGLQSAQHLVPPECAELYKSAKIHSMQAIEVAVLANLRRMTPELIAQIPDVSEGLENRIFEAAKEHKTLGKVIDAIQTKRYTYSRIRRIMLHSYLEVTRNDLISPQYLRILDFSPQGQEILNGIKKETTLPLTKNFSQLKKQGSAQAIQMWEQELVFDNLYELC